MAAEAVILENLERILNDNKNVGLSKNDLQILATSISNVKGAVAALQGGDQILIRNEVGNLVARLHQVEDLLDEIITYNNSPRLPSVTADEDENQVRNPGRVQQFVINATSKVTQKVGLRFLSFKQDPPLLSVIRQLQNLVQYFDDQGKMLRNKFLFNGQLERLFKPPQSYTLVRSRVIGRDNDVETIIKMLLRPPREDESNIPVISITGSPGLGKSALAQVVYEDEKVKSHFDLRIWVRVSQIYDERDIIREIVESCKTRRSNYRRIPRKPAKFQRSIHQNGLVLRDLLGCQNTSEVLPSYGVCNNESDIYERRLQKEIKGKLFLLVLDDDCITHGQSLKDLLTAGARGSRILVTTRRVEVAETGTAEPYKLQGLSDDDSWSLFQTFAFGQANPKKTFKNIGCQVARNCGGAPLAIKVAASYLYGKSEEQWLAFNNELIFDARHGDKLQHILHLSYKDLPTRLKACFGYCSLFPEDFKIKKHDLICLWIAQGFIEPQHDQTMEEVAEKYFMELSRRCFFEDVITDDLGNIVICKMHHIMRSLAYQYSKGIMSVDMTGEGCNLDPSSKHVSFTCDRDSLKTITPTIPQDPNLRTLLSVTEPDSNTYMSSLVCNMLISSLKCLRVLVLQDLGLKELPTCIGKLIHLRYLDLSKNDALSTLPKSVTELYNLQTLKLNSCTNLKRLPGNFGELVNLRRLDVDECDSLTSMPLGLEKLIHLETLSRFVLGQDISKDNASIGLKALKDLKELRGRLAIEFMGDWTTAICEAPQAELQNKSELAELRISWAKTRVDCKKTAYLLSEEEKKCYKQLLEELQPNSNLKILSIEGYRGEDFPTWAGVNMLVSSLPNLVVISIEGCDKCEHLPPFGKLPFLKRLTLRHMANVRYIQRESFQASIRGNQESISAFPSSYLSLRDMERVVPQKSSAGDSPEAHPEFSSLFKSLEELTLHNFFKLEGWWKPELMLTSEEEIPFFPRLSKLRIWNCPNLHSMPLFTQVIDLELRNVNQMLLEKCAMKLSRKREKEDYEALISTSSSIRTLQIKGCPDLRSFAAVRKGLGGLSCLKQLVIEKCHSLRSISSELSYLTALQRLEISNCKELDLSEVGRDNVGDRYPVPTPWTSLAYLRHLTLREIPKMESLPDGLEHVQTLRSLWISACHTLTVLPPWIASLTALQHLRIESCEGVTSLPDGIKDIKSLMKVEITECPELMKRCKEHTGEDWHKIKHARVLLHKSWRYGLMSELGSSQNRSNVAYTGVKYIILPVIAAETMF